MWDASATTWTVFPACFGFIQMFEKPAMYFHGICQPQHGLCLQYVSGLFKCLKSLPSIYVGLISHNMDRVSRYFVFIQIFEKPAMYLCGMHQPQHGPCFQYVSSLFKCLKSLPCIYVGCISHNMDRVSSMYRVYSNV